MNERDKIYKRARNMRKATQSARNRPRHQPSYESWDDDTDESVGTVRMKPKGNGSLDAFVDRVIEDEIVAEQISNESGSATEVTVVHIELGRCTALFDDGSTVEAELPEHIRVVQRTVLAVGDRATIDSENRVLEVLPRRTSLSRPDPGNVHVERAIAANVDCVVIVAALESPPLRPGLIDRYLVAIERGGARAVICVNKVDLVDADARSTKLAVLDDHRALGYPVVTVSAQTGEGLDEVREELAGSLAVFVGHSGVGKSSLLNALAPQLALLTGDVTRYAGKGRHTTTSSTLHDLGGGTRIIDTPGIRSFGLHKLSAVELATYFPEIQELGQRCRFRDCTHREEPKCAVRDGAASGVLSERRYSVYRSLYQEIVGS